MQLLKVKLNGEDKLYSQIDITISEILEKEQISQKGIAIALNNVLVPKDKILSVKLRMHDEIEIVTPFEGG
ncbi:sulfur carrier protein ThiS [Pigmentibacter sp. JX0631]|uniref:sulfur carrier protein ThiS n=1 Tax=Pigmentibacter sp. JX0631 TaxID=2976982 RepID=UPI0024695F8E|nr:sulfur carrier protein ThiS [Pigmentibacter sp. JX0631]WGL60140.1 sulfur carrier protein ThiS [Pigmentibacter sp. JX0631]